MKATTSPNQRGALLCLTIITVGSIVVAASRIGSAVDVRIANVVALGTRRFVAVEFRSRNPAARFHEPHRVQLRVAGRWQPPMDPPEFGKTDLLAETNRQRVVFSFPAEAEACRFSLGYRVGPRPYCQAYFFLERHGLFQKFPKLSRAVLKRVPDQPRLRRAECELIIPKSPGEVD